MERARKHLPAANVASASRSRHAAIRGPVWTATALTNSYDIFHREDGPHSVGGNT